MANGKAGDHPLTDILNYRLEVYGTETDELIRKIADLCSRRELDEWWEREIGWSNERDRVAAFQKAKARFEQLLSRARENRWENEV